MNLHICKSFFFLLAFTSGVQGAFTIYLLNPWAKDPARDSSRTYIISSEPGWYPGSLMTNDYGDWLMYTFKSQTTTSNDRVEFMNVIPSLNDTYDKKAYYRGGSTQILIKDIFTGHENATEVWITVTDTSKPPQVQFVSPPCKVIRFFKPWDFGGVFIEIKDAGTYRMRGLGDYCGWLTNKYESASKNISVRFFTSIDSTRYGTNGLKDAGYIDLSTTFAQSDTAWILGNADGPPSISTTFPGKLGDCSTLRLASKLRDIDTAHPGFNKDVCHSWVGRGIWSGLVKNRLGPDGKPVLNDTVQCGLKKIDWFDAQHFANGYTNEKCFNLVLRKNDEGLYEYDTNEFFPLDSFKYLDNNNTVPNPNNNLGNQTSGHNISFSMETGAEFEYRKGQKFYFRGDDDVWVYIDSQLVVDLGGIHNPQEESIDLDTLGLTPGKTYSFKLFFCERNCCGSSFRMVTSLNLRTSSKLYHTDTTLSPGTVRYTIFEKVTQDNMACDASSTIIDTVKASVNFYIEGPSFSTPTKLPAGVSYGGVTVLSDFTGIVIDEPSITGLMVGEYTIHYFSTKDNSMDGILKFLVVPRPRITNPVKSAAFFSDGKGSVDRAEIFFTDTLKVLPDSIHLMWPSILDSKLITNGAVLDSLNKRHITVKIANPFPAGITTYSGSSQLGKCFFHDSTFTANPVLTVPFSVADSIGPLIKSAVLIERIEPGKDTIFLTFSETLKDTTFTGNALVLFRNGQKIILPVLNTFHRGDTIVFISENQNENSPKTTDSIALSSVGPVCDEFGNKAHPDNRPVPFTVRKVPGKLVQAYYSDTDADGFIDGATLRFNKQIVLSEIKATFHWVIGLKSAVLDLSRFKFGKDSTELIVNLTGAFSQKTVITSGEMTTEVEFSGRPGKQTFQVADSAAPVMTSAKLIPGAQSETSIAPDKLNCTFSEEVPSISCKNPFQFSTVDNNQNVTYELTLSSPSQTTGIWTFVVDAIKGVEFPQEGDSVWINSTCGITDQHSNKQTNPNNHRVLLAFDTIPFTYNMKAGPNPIHTSESNSMIVIKIDPLQKLRQYVNYRVEMEIFDYLGTIIYTQTVESQKSPTVAVSLNWNGRNKKGRLVGYGTYLAVIKIHNNRGNTDKVETVKIGVAR